MPLYQFKHFIMRDAGPDGNRLAGCMGLIAVRCSNNELCLLHVHIAVPAGSGNAYKKDDEVSHGTRHLGQEFYSNVV